MSEKELAELPDGWCVSTVADVINIIDYRGRTPPYSQDGIPHIRSSNIKNGRVRWEDLSYVTQETYDAYMTRGIPMDGDVLFTTEAPLGQVSLAPKIKFSIAQRLMILQPDRNILMPLFLMYQIMSSKFQGLICRRGTGTTVTGVSSKNFRPTPVILAPVEEQTRIVSEIEKQFTRLDSAEAALHSARRRLNRYRSAVLRDASVGRLVPTAGGWEESTLERLCSLGRTCAYGVLQPGSDVQSGVNFIRVGDIYDGRIETANLKKIATHISSQYKRTILHGGELLITLVGTIGRTAVVPPALAGANTARAVGVIPLGDRVLPEWVNIWFQNPIKIREIEGQAHEVARKTLNLEDVRKTVVLIPPLPEQHRIVAEVERRLSVVEKLEASIEQNLKRAARMRQSILHRAFTGQLVPQDPNDEPADKLLARIRAERDAKPVRKRS